MSVMWVFAVLLIVFSMASSAAVRPPSIAPGSDRAAGCGEIPAGHSDALDGPLGRVGRASAVCSEPLWSRALDPDRPRRDVAVETLLSDFDGDGANELVVAAIGRKGPWFAALLEPMTGEERWRVTFPARPVVGAADLGRGGGDELIAAHGREIVILDGIDGEPIRSTRIRNWIGELDVGVIDGDGVPDIIYTAGAMKDDLLIALSGADLSEIWLITAAEESGPFARGFGELTVEDTDGDRLDEILVTENANTLVCLGAHGEERWRAHLGDKGRYVPAGVASDRPVMCDLTGDGTNEVAIGCFAGALMIMDATTGDVLRRMQFGVESHAGFARNRRIPRRIREMLAKSGEPLFGLTPVDLDGRPGDELVFGCSDGFLYAVAPAGGEVLWRFDTRHTVYEACVSLELTGDGRADILAWDAGALYMLDGRRGTSLPGSPLPFGAARVHSDDLDGDGFLEIIAAGIGGRGVGVWPTRIAAFSPASGLARQRAGEGGAQPEPRSGPALPGVLEVPRRDAVGSRQNEGGSGGD